MCGIIGIYRLKEDKDAIRTKALSMAKIIRHRGPDWSGIYEADNCVLAHERLSIVDIEHGAQPLIDEKKRRALAVNGEIYNHRDLRDHLARSHEWKTKSDCEVLLYLYDEEGPGFLEKLNGIFAFVLYDEDKDEIFAARDHIGIIPLYIGWDDLGQVYFASEMKALDGVCKKIEEFPPAHYFTSDGLKRWYNPSWKNHMPKERISETRIRTALEKAVKRQLMSDVPYGLLISGGLDSSIIAAIASRFRKRRIESDDEEEAWWPQLHSFSIGLEGSPDLAAARKVARHVGTIHHEITYSLQEGLDALKDVIYHLETWDVTTVRAATPMYLMSRKIKSMGIKMILSGEGADEVFGGYLYFHMAPDKKEFHDEVVRKLSKLSKYDCLRANKAMAAWGVEARVPFLDKDFLETAMAMDPEQKMCGEGKVEKEILRRAFADYLPEEILWRQKEQFSDGVGYGWIDHLKQLGKETVSDDMMSKAVKRFSHLPPQTKEEYMYRSIFEEMFGKACTRTVFVEPSIACSTSTALKWSKSFQGKEDPSGRAVSGVHKDAVMRI